MFMGNRVGGFTINVEPDFLAVKDTLDISLGKIRTESLGKYLSPFL